MEQQIKQATVTTQYRDILVLHLDALTILYRELLRDYIKAKYDEDNFDKCITEMVVILDHIIPKLEGSAGANAPKLLEKLNKFIEWTENIMIPKSMESEKERMHTLFKLIIKAYDVLGLSPC